jgi:hypothetical protein
VFLHPDIRNGAEAPLLLMLHAARGLLSRNSLRLSPALRAEILTGIGTAASCVHCV